MLGASLPAVLFTALVACGARSEILGTGGAETTSSASSSSSSGAGGGPCTWSFSAPISIAPNAVAYDAVNDDDRIVVSLKTDDLRIKLRVVNQDLSSVGDLVDIGPHLLTSFAFGFGRRMVLGAQDSGQVQGGRCAVVSLDAMDHPLGPPSAPFAHDGCFWPVATPAGALVFWRHYPKQPVDDKSVTTFSVDAGGHVLGENPDALPVEATVPEASAKAVLDDGTVLTVWLGQGVLSAQRFAADGSPLGDAKPLMSGDASDIVDLLPQGPGALMAWSDGGRVRTAMLDADGNLGPQHVIPDSKAGEVLELVTTPEGVLLVEAVDKPPLCACGVGAPFVTLVVRQLDATGAPMSPRIKRVFDEFEDYSVAKVVPSGAGAVLIMNAEPKLGDAGVWATRLDCLQ